MACMQDTSNQITRTMPMTTPMSTAPSVLPT